MFAKFQLCVSTYSIVFSSLNVNICFAEKVRNIARHRGNNCCANMTHKWIKTEQATRSELFSHWNRTLPIFWTANECLISEVNTHKFAFKKTRCTHLCHSWKLANWTGLQALSCTRCDKRHQGMVLRGDWPLWNKTQRIIVTSQTLWTKSSPTPWMYTLVFEPVSTQPFGDLLLCRRKQTFQCCQWTLGQWFYQFLIYTNTKWSEPKSCPEHTTKEKVSATLCS